MKVEPLSSNTWQTTEASELFAELLTGRNDLGNLLY